MAEGAAKQTPEVTVLMPVYNGQRFLPAAIESILNQSLDDFELLVIDDGSSDDSLAIIQKYCGMDSRIRLISRENKGLVETLNEGIDGACGEWLARQDCDDVSLPDRLAMQLAFLREHPDHVFCASDAYIVNQYGRRVRRWPDLGHSREELRASLRFSAAFPHSSVCFNLSLLRKYDLRYKPEYPQAEDFDLWQRITADYPCCVIPQTLLEWRSHPASINYSQRLEQFKQTSLIVERHFRLLDEGMPDGFLCRFLDEQRGISGDEHTRLRKVLLKMLQSIDAESPVTRHFSRTSFSIFLSRMFVNLGGVRGFDDANRVFGCAPLQKLLTRRARLLFLLSRVFSSNWVGRLDTVISYMHTKLTDISSCFRRGN